MKRLDAGASFLFGHPVQHIIITWSFLIEVTVLIALRLSVRPYVSIRVPTQESKARERLKLKKGCSCHV